MAKSTKKSAGKGAGKPVRTSAGKEPVQHDWTIYRIRGTPAEYIGHVTAPDEDAAIRKAIEEYAITDREKQKRLIARRNA